MAEARRTGPLPLDELERTAGTGDLELAAALARTIDYRVLSAPTCAAGAGIRPAAAGGGHAASLRAGARRRRGAGRDRRSLRRRTAQLARGAVPTPTRMGAAPAPTSPSIAATEQSLRAIDAALDGARGRRWRPAGGRQPVACLHQPGHQPDRQAGALDALRCAARRRQRRAPGDRRQRAGGALSHRRRAGRRWPRSPAPRSRSRSSRASRSWRSSTSPSAACRRTAASRSPLTAGPSTSASPSSPACSARTRCCACWTSRRSPSAAWPVAGLPGLRLTTSSCSCGD